MEIFGKYGNIIEEIIMRRSFGFIQYDSPEAALAALQHEQGRSIGGLRVDISLADNRDARTGKRGREEDRFPRGGGRFGDRPGGDRFSRDRDRDRDDRDRDRDRDDYRDRRDRDGGYRDGKFKRSRFDEPPPRDIRGGSVASWRAQQQAVVYSIVYLGLNQKAYANSIRQMVEERLGVAPQSGVVEATFLGRLSMDEIYAEAERRNVRYVLMVSGKHERNSTVDVTFIQRGRPKSSVRDVSCREAIDIITQGAGTLGQTVGAAPVAPGYGQQGPGPSGGYFPAGAPPPAQGAAPYGAAPTYAAAAAPAYGGPAQYGGPQPPAAAVPNLQTILSAAGGNANLVAALANLLTGIQGQPQAPAAAAAPMAPAPAPVPAAAQYTPYTPVAPQQQPQQPQQPQQQASYYRPLQQQPQQQPQQQTTAPSQASTEAGLPAQLTSLLNETNLALLSSSMQSLLSPAPATTAAATSQLQQLLQQQQTTQPAQATGGYAAYGQQQPQQQQPQQQYQPQQQPQQQTQYRPSPSVPQSYQQPQQQPQQQYRPQPPLQQPYGVAGPSYPPAQQQQQQPPQQGWGQGGYKPQ